MKGIFHSSDVLCRWGGDEFVIYIPEVLDQHTIEVKIQLFQKKMKQHMLNSSPLPITLSIGAILFECAHSLPELLGETDQLLYKVKKLGRDNYCISCSEKEKKTCLII